MGEPRSSYLGVMFQIWPPTKQIVDLGVGLVNWDGFVFEFGTSTIWHKYSELLFIAAHYSLLSNYFKFSFFAVEGILRVLVIICLFSQFNKLIGDVLTKKGCLSYA